LKVIFEGKQTQQVQLTKTIWLVASWIQQLAGRPLRLGRRDEARCSEGNRNKGPMEQMFPCRHHVPVSLFCVCVTSGNLHPVAVCPGSGL